MARLYTFDVEAYLQNNTHVYLGKQEIYVPICNEPPSIGHDINITGKFNYLSDCFPPPYENILFGSKSFQWSSNVHANSIAKLYIPLGEFKYTINTSAIAYLSFSKNGYVANVFDSGMVYLYGNGFNGDSIARNTGWSMPSSTYGAKPTQSSEFFAIETNGSLITALYGMGIAIAIEENVQVYSRSHNYAIYPKLIEWFNALEYKELSFDPYQLGGDSSTSLPTGDFDDTSDPVDFPSLPSIAATDTGLITLYNPTLYQIRDLANYMWTNPAFDISAWKKIFADPIDAILGLSIVPVDVPDGGVRPIAVGNLTTDVNMNVAAKQYIEVQCGALNVNEFWSSYLDYDPYTKAEIYLPYCGTHQLSVDDIMNKTIEVRYHIDILSGSCCAYVKCGDSVLYQFIGQCSSSIPVASGDFSEIVSSAINAALAVGSVIATGGASAPFAATSFAANSVNILKEKVQKSGVISGTGGMLAIQKPYLILTRPRQAHPANQNHYTGYPSFITENLSELSGYTEIEEIHLENVQATDTELNEIVTLLESGVIF